MSESIIQTFFFGRLRHKEVESPNKSGGFDTWAWSLFDPSAFRPGRKTHVSLSKGRRALSEKPIIPASKKKDLPHMDKKEMNGEKYMSPFVGKVCVYNLICQFEKLNAF